LTTAALFRDGELIAEREADARRKHAETVLPMIDAMLEESGVPFAEIDLFAVDIGPGSFTGVRIGVSLVNALAFAAGKKIVPVDALLALALSAGETDAPVAAMIDARNGNAYAALYQQAKALIEPHSVIIDDFLSDLPAGAVVVGDVRTHDKTYPRAKFVGLAALLRPGGAIDETEPVYLRPSQAERLKKQPGKEA
jgi:tRNA threonylcarbamoyl adenosine modification protein YeaZ